MRSVAKQPGYTVASQPVAHGIQSYALAVQDDRAVAAGMIAEGEMMVYLLQGWGVFFLFACFALFLTRNKNVTLCNDRAGSIVSTWQKLQRRDFLGHYKYDKRKTLPDGSTV